MSALVVSTFPNAKALPLWAGRQAGLFERFGLDLVIDLTPGSKVQREKLIDGRINIAQAAVDNALQLILDGHDVIIVMGGESGMNDFIVQGDVTGYDDFRGRALVVDAPDTGYALQARKLLASAGLKAGEDYQLRPIGNASQRLRAMREDKSNAGAIMNPPFSAQACLLGMKSLGRLTDLLGPYQAGGTFLRRDWARKYPDQLEAYIKAYVSSVRWTLDPANKSAATQILARELGIEPAIAEAACAQLVEPGFGFAIDARLDRQGFANMLATRAQTQGRDARIADFAACIDESYYQRAVSRLPGA